MKYEHTHWDDLGVTLQLSTLGAGGVEEHHALLHVEARGELFQGQLTRILKAEERLQERLPAARIVFARYLLSDATNQAPLIPRPTHHAIGLIQQPPLDGSKLAVWLYLLEGAEVEHTSEATLCRHNGYTHIWQMGLTHSEGDSAHQTEALLSAYEQMLQQHHATLLDNCIRTWFYVRDVDTQYAGMVRARRDNFVQQGLTPDTHYVASTGIQGLPADTHAIIQLDTYAMTGLEPEQQRYVHALSHLNRTIEYGVTFERGTVVEYGDRAHCYISGTASINNKGEVVHVGDIKRQTERMWENVEKLLEEGQFSMSDVAEIIVYLRDAGDYELVHQMFEARFPHTPFVITLAPVCRPEWLIEMECIAITERSNPQFRAL